MYAHSHVDEDYRPQPGRHRKPEPPAQVEDIPPLIGEAPTKPIVYQQLPMPAPPRSSALRTQDLEVWPWVQRHIVRPFTRWIAGGRL